LLYIFVILEQIGPAPASTRWTVLCLDFQYILSMYLNRRYSYMKSIKLCANMLVKNIYTSDLDYEPGLFLSSCHCRSRWKRALSASVSILFHFYIIILEVCLSMSFNFLGICTIPYFLNDTQSTVLRLQKILHASISMPLLNKILVQQKKCLAVNVILYLLYKKDIFDLAQQI
jgi:hypothetical protein